MSKYPPRRSLKSAILACALLLCIPAPAVAQETTRLLLEFGNVRSSLYGILAERPKGGSRFAYYLADMNALNPDRNSYPYVAHTNWAITPSLRYEGNVNDGIEADVIHIGGLPFTIDEESKAISAMTAGVAVSAAGAYALGRGVLLSTSVRSEMRKAIENETFTVTEHSLNTALSYTSQKMWYGSLNGAITRRDTDYAQSKRQSFGFTLGKVFGDRHAVHDLSLGASKVFNDDVWQDRAVLTWSMAKPTFGHVQISAQVGAAQENKMLFRHSLAVSYSNFIWKQPTTISLGASVSDGGKFFGKDRTDNVYTASFERKLMSKLNGYVSVAKRDSTAEIYDSTTIDMGFIVRGWRF